MCVCMHACYHTAVLGFIWLAGWLAGWVDGLLFGCLIFETGSCYIALVSLEVTVWTSLLPVFVVLHSVGNTGIRHSAWQESGFQVSQT